MVDDQNLGNNGTPNNDLSQSFLRERGNLYEEATNLERGIYYNSPASLLESLKRQNNQLLFALDSSYLERINNSFISFFHTDMRLVYAFELELDSMLGHWDVPDMHFDLRIQPFNNSYLLSENLRGRYHSDIAVFNGNSDNLFLPPELVGNRSWTTQETAERSNAPGLMEPSRF